MRAPPGSRDIMGGAADENGPGTKNHRPGFALHSAAHASAVATVRGEAAPARLELGGDV